MAILKQMNDMSNPTARYRERYRSEQIGPACRGGLHLAFTVIFTRGGTGLAATQLEAVRPLDRMFGTRAGKGDHSRNSEPQHS